MVTLRPSLVLATTIALALAPLAAQKRSGPKQEATFPDLVKTANAAWDSKDYGAAVSALQEALRLAQLKQRDALLAALPRPEGWTVEDERNEAIDNPVLGGFAALGSTVTRRYRKGEKTLSIEVLANSPLANMVTMMLTNPTLLQAQGGEVVEYGAHKALLKKEGDANFEMQILMNNKHIVTVKSENLTDAEMLAIVDQKAVDAMDKHLGK